MGHTLVQRRRPKAKGAAGKARGRGHSKVAARQPVAVLRASLGMARVRFARLLGRTERALIEWEAGRSTPQGLSLQRVRELERLVEALCGLFEAQTVGDWFETPNKALDGLKPIEAMERGQTDRLWRMVFELESGMHV